MKAWYAVQKKLRCFVIRFSMAPRIKKIEIDLLVNNYVFFQLPLANCEAYHSSCTFCDVCRMCILARDPMCGWNKSLKVRAVRTLRRHAFLPNTAVSAAIIVSGAVTTRVRNFTRTGRKRSRANAYA